MSDYKVSGASLTSVANAIRTKGGTSADLSFPNGFVTAIDNIPGGPPTLISKSITANGTYDPTDDNADGYSSVTVNVSQSSTPFVKVGTYTVTESWESGQTALTMSQSILDGYLDANAVAYVMIVNNNTNTSSYRADAIIVISNATTTSGLPSAYGAVWKNYYASTSGLSSTSRISQGATVDIYRALHT